MRFSEISSFKPMLVEFGSRHGFPGFGQSLFRSAHYNHVAKALSYIHEDEAIRLHLTDWFVSAFKRDNMQFKEDAFRMVASGERPSFGRASYPQFQQRHFYYLAYLVSQEPDMNVREYLAHWLADKVGNTNAQFQRTRWFKFCKIDDDE